MPASFDCDDAGRLTAAIPDAAGEFHAYELRLLTPADPAWAALMGALLAARFPPALRPGWACLLRRLDTDAEHYVARLGPAKWWCSCADYTYRSRKTPDACKHCQHGRALFALHRSWRPLGVAS